VPIRSQNYIFSFVALLALLLGYSSPSYSQNAYWYVTHAAQNTACGQHSSKESLCTCIATNWSTTYKTYDHVTMLTSNTSAQCYGKSTSGTVSNIATMYLQNTGQCDAGYTWNATTFQCDTDCPAGQHKENGTCVNDCELGFQKSVAITGANSAEVKLKAVGTYCDGACTFQVGAAVPTYDSGSNCTIMKDTSWRCYYTGSGTGASCSNSTAGITPASSSQPETIKTTTTNDGAGTTTSSTTTSTVNPDGSVTETTTTTTTKDGVSTTSTSSTTKSGTGTGNVSGSEGTGEGAGHTNGTGTGTGTGTGAGDCDPTAANYMQCVGLTEEIADTKAGELKTEGDTAMETQLSDYEQAVTDARDQQLQNTEQDGPESLTSYFQSVIPQPTGCSSMTLNFPGHQLTLPCERFDFLKELFGWMLGCMTIIYIFRLATNSGAQT